MNLFYTKKLNVHTTLARFVSVYLIFFLIGCSSAPPPLTVAEARSMQTRTINADYNKVMKASINVLQDLNYTIDEISENIGIIIASRVSEKPQGKINREETVVDEGAPTWLKVIGIVFIVAVVSAILYAIFGGNGDDDDDDDNDNHSHRGRGGNSTTIIREGRDKHKVYKYNITINLESINEQETKVRVSLQGQQMRGSDVERAGAVNDLEFFQRFFANLDKSLFLE